MSGQTGETNICCNHRNQEAQGYYDLKQNIMKCVFSLKFFLGGGANLGAFF